MTYRKLPFETVITRQFPRVLLYGNPLLDNAPVPAARTLLRMLECEYNGVVGPVTGVIAQCFILNPSLVSFRWCFIKAPSDIASFSLKKDTHFI